MKDSRVERLFRLYVHEWRLFRMNGDNLRAKIAVLGNIEREFDAHAMHASIHCQPNLATNQTIHEASRRLITPFAPNDSV
ncbi:MAG: hypothetical protein ACN6IW_00500 [Paracoccaceae bacterium]